MKIRSLEDIVAIEQANPDPFSSLTCTYGPVPKSTLVPSRFLFS